MKRLLIIFGTGLALVATSNPNRTVEPTCNVAMGTFTVGGSCGWDGGVTLAAVESDRTRCEVQFTGAVESTAFTLPDAGRLEFEDTSARNDAGERSCAAREFPDGGYEVICDRCPPTGNCRPDCVATFTPGTAP